MDNKKIPNHVAIILDGNGRWAREKGKKRTEGHKAGYENLKKISKYIFNSGTNYLSLFVFSTENFSRPQEEVDFLMDLFVEKFKKDAKYFKKENIRVLFSGSKDGLREDVIETMEDMQNTTKDNDGGILNFCLNYGGRQEIVDATNKIIASGVKSIDVEDFKRYLYNDLPDIDLLIRTSGEIRISNFMLWQLSYAEMYFPKCYFPDFNEEEYDMAITEYTKRDRRFGGLNNEQDKNN